MAQVTAAFNGTTSTSQTTCAGSGQTYTINATSTLASGYEQKLQVFINNTWTDLTTGSTQTSFAVTAPATAGTYLYRLVSALAANISSPNCVVASNDLTIVTTPSPTAQFTYTANTCLGMANAFTDASDPQKQILLQLHRELDP